MAWTKRRSLLVAVCAVLLVADCAFLAMRSAPDAERGVDHIGASPFGFILPEAKPLPWLDGDSWQLDRTPIRDIVAYSRDAAIREGNMSREGPVALVSLGPNPSFGQFLRTVRNLRENGICHVVIREAAKPGDVYDFGAPWGKQRAIDSSSLGLCDRALH